MRSMLNLASGIVGLLIVSIGAAYAAPAGFCRSYARTASAQYQESRQNGCGLFGGRWQESLDAHFNWCLGSAIATVEAEEDYRDRELRSCRRNLPVLLPTFEETRRADCRNYSRIASQQNETQELLRCGFRGGRWQSNDANHFNWCVTQEKATTDRHNADRDRDVRQCRADKEAAMQPQRPRFGFTIDLNFGKDFRQPSGPKAQFCRNYAREAVQQNERQQDFGCDFFGNRWVSRLDTHFRYCMANERRASLRELDARRISLRRCEVAN
jgi:hypothetical protein